LNTKYLIDASALYPLIIKLGEKIIDHMEKLAILDLTIYEIGNVLWKKARSSKIINIESVVLFSKNYLQTCIS
jgi:predicted nucleic acid-binding protein